MGVLHLECAISDADGTSLYGLAYGSDYSVEKNSASNYERIIIVQSNSNPTSVTNMTWRVVSTFKRDSLVLLTGSSTTCTVDDQGVFAAVSLSTGISAAPGGVRFNPDGGGSWSNVSFPVNYGWQNSVQSNVLFTLKSSMGSNQLIHALVGATPGAIAFATLSSSSPYRFGSTASWLMGSNVDLATSHIAYSNGALLYLSSTLISPKLTAIPVSTISSSMPEGSTTTSFNMASACGVIGRNFATAFGSKVYYQCSVLGAPNSTLILVNDIPTATTAGQQLLYYYSNSDADIFAPVTSAKGQPPFFFLQTSTGTAGFFLTGPSSSNSIISGPVQISETLGETPDPSSPQVGSGSNGSQSDGLSTGAKIGIGIGVFILVVACLLTCCRSDKERDKKRKENTVYHTPELIAVAYDTPGIHPALLAAHQRNDQNAGDRTDLNLGWVSDMKTNPGLPDTSQRSQLPVTTTGGDPQELPPAWSATSILTSLGSNSTSRAESQSPQEFGPADILESLVPPREPGCPQDRRDGRNPQYRGDN